VAGSLVVTHRSRLAAVLVDVPATDRDRAAEFWSKAFGTPGRPGTEYPEYHVFGTVTPGVIAMVQATGDDQPRVHFDIETDDVEAEVSRLEELGATEVQRAGTWVVLRDPVGTVFCVVEIQVKEMFEQHAHTWE
jgi:predicted enzyme related to lactoylglutathione lyase